jgi:hypothetical protein
MQNSDVEAAQEMQVISAGTPGAEMPRCFIYRGRSMTPTFRAGHFLYVRPTARDITPGDVIVFLHPSQNGYVVHRVVSATDGGWITRGDNNTCDDDRLVAADQVIGRVEMVEEQGRRRRVRGGRGALVSAKIGRYLLQWIRRLRRVLGNPYRVLRRSETMRRILARLFAPRFEYLSLQTCQGTLVKVIHHGKVVARWYPNANRFECDKPYDLVIPRPDEK